jgi:hypothetical protein
MDEHMNASKIRAVKHSDVFGNNPNRSVYYIVENTDNIYQMDE